MEYRIFEDLLQMNGLTVYKVSKATGIAQSTFSDWKSGRSTPKADKLKKIAEFFGVSVSYLLEGDDELMGDPRVRGVFGTRCAVPIIGEIRAGSPIITNETLLGYESADIDSAEDYFYLRVRGDSMKDIGMVEGSIVLFHKQQYAENGDIVACLVDGDSATVKRFEKKNHRIILSPENDAYSPIVLTPEDFETGRSRILGVAVEAKTKF